MVLVALAFLSININSAGGIVRGFNQALGLPSGAIEIVQEDASRYLLVAQVKGRNAITEEPVEAEYEVIEPLTSNDLLVRDRAGVVYRIGQSQECQIVASQIRIARKGEIAVKITNLTLDDEDLQDALRELVVASSQFGVTKQLRSEGRQSRTTNSELRTYLTGTLTISDAEDLSLPTHVDRFDSITLQPGAIAYARLTSASPQEVMTLLGDYSASGNLIVRSIHVL
jgi:inner membrane protein